ncbi:MULTISPECIES: WD40 repeat domain-containing protein, partial [unclassified Endozoicomonas]|uniref:WD40 repeat domain-containing protein n=4 Tax=Endozoicomonas TaxID=305899 RepID=UPI00214949EA
MNGYILKKRLPHATGFIRALKYNHSGTLLAAGASDNTVKVYNVTNDYALERELHDATEKILSITFNHDGSLLVAAAEDGQIRIYAVANSFNLERVLFYRKTGGALSMAFNHDSSLLAAGGYEINFYRGKSPYTHLRPQLYTARGVAADSIAFNPSGTRLAAGRNDGQVWIYSGTSPFKHLKTLTDGHNRMYSIAYAQNNKWLAVGDLHQKVLIYELDTPSPSLQPPTSEFTTASVAHTSPSSESLLGVSSAVPSSSAQPLTSTLPTTSVARTSSISVSPS